MEKAKVVKFLTHDPADYTDDENLRWCWLRAVEWGECPLFIGQVLAPVLFLFFQWWLIGAAIVILGWLWALVRHRYVSVLLAQLGPLVIILKWLVSIGIGIYFLIKGHHMLAAISGFWPLISLLLMLLTPPSKTGIIQTALMSKLGYERL